MKLKKATEIKKIFSKILFEGGVKEKLFNDIEKYLKINDLSIGKQASKSDDVESIGKKWFERFKKKYKYSDDAKDSFLNIFMEYYN